MLRPHRPTARRAPLVALLVLALLAPLFAGAPKTQAATPIFPLDERSLFGGIALTKSVAFGDIDNDGDLDLVAGLHGQSAAYLNDGSGGFWGNTPDCDQTERVSCFGPPEGQVDALALGDLDGDGDLDIVAGGVFGTTIYQNEMGRLTAIAELSVWPSALALGDLVDEGGLSADDGQLDLVVGNEFADTQIYRNTGDGFELFADLDLQASSLALGDINGDGSLDIVGGSENRGTRAYGNTGGGFALLAGLGAAASTLALGDINGDGALDLVTGSIFEGAALYLSQNGAFGAPTPVGRANGPVRSVALGDMDGDGKLDIVVGSRSAIGDDLDIQDAVYFNRNGFFVGDPIDCSATGKVSCFGIGFDRTMSVALGDVDGDGDLDIAAGNDGAGSMEQSAVYLNSGGGSFAAEVQPLASVNTPMRRIALGDLNGDGHLDIAAANDDSTAQLTGWNYPRRALYLNDGANQFSTVVTAFGDPAVQTTSVAIGDLNGDNHLDLVWGNLGAPSAVYLNNGGGAFPSPRPFGPATPGNGPLSLALGDVDGDGDLDIVAGNLGLQGAVYLNDGRGNFPTERLYGPGGDDTQGVALGDLDGDGDLDLAAANNYGRNFIYHNDGLGNFTIADTIGIRASSVALGDLDGDGDLDVVLGSYLSTSFFNDGTGRFPVERPLNNGSKVALGDMDGDGDLDLITHTFTQSAVYLNTGAGDFPTSGERVFSSPQEEIESVGLGDMDGDGDLDIVGGVRPYFYTERDQQSAIYLNGQQGDTNLADSPPQVRVLRPGPTPPAAFYSTPVILDSPVIEIDYRLADPEGDPVRAVRGEYSLDGGGSWREAVPDAATGLNLAELAAPPEGATYRFGWDTFASGFFGQSDNVVFRIVALPDLGPRENRAAGPFQRPYVAASSLPFRVRGTQVQVKEDTAGAPVSGALVYRLPAGSSAGALPLSRPDGAPLTTDGQGFLQGRGAIAAGDRLVALAPISATDTMTLYHTSAAPSPAGLEVAPVTEPGVQELTVSAEHPLALFNLELSLEWDARSDPRYLARLEEDLRRASAALYDISDGQAALGDITVYHDKERWNDAHIRVYATNRLRPNANQGGIVTAPVSETLTIGGEERTLTYEPGQIRMGAVWNRYGEPSGTLGDDWPRTLAHELGHFALFLDDNYLGFDGGGRLVSVSSCPGVMSDPYIDNTSELRPVAGWLPGCAQTLSHRLTGRADWETVERFYDFPELEFRLSGPAAFNQNPGPAVQPLALTRVRFVEPAPPAGPAGEPIEAPAIYLIDPAGATLQPAPGARAFLFQAGRDRLVDLGNVVLDRVEQRGARAGDRLCVFEPAGGRLGCEQLSAASQQLTLRELPGWRPDLTITPVTSRTIEIALRELPAELDLRARLYPVDYDASAELRLTAGPGGYSGSFSLAEPALSGYVHVWVEEGAGAAGPRRELVSDYTVGGNPGSEKNRTTQRNNPGSEKNRTAPVLSGDGQAILFTAGDDLPENAFFTLQSLPAREPPAWAAPVGTAYRLTASAGAQALLAGSSINIGYLSAEVPPGTEQGIAVFFRPPAGGPWQRLPTALDVERNEASAAAQGPGQYALMTQVEVRDGWNLLAYPWPDAPSVPAALAQIGARDYTTVYGYDDNSPADPWQVYDVDTPPWVNDLSRLRYGQGYWVRVEAAEEQTAALAEVGAAEALPTPPATFYAIVDDLGASSVRAGQEVAALVGGLPCATTRAFASGASGGRVVFVIDVPAADAARPGCGVPGRAVTFSVGGRSLPLSATWTNGRPQNLRAPAGATLMLYLPLIRR